MGRDAWVQGRSRTRAVARSSSRREQSRATDPLYLFACQLEWERRADPSAAWEVISAARSTHADTRAHARALLERSQQIRTQCPEEVPAEQGHRRSSTAEAGMRTPYGLEIIESCMSCKVNREGFFCRFSPPCCGPWTKSVITASCRRERCCSSRGRLPRGVFILCSGK